MITLLRVLQIQSTSRILRLLVGHRVSFLSHFLATPTLFYWHSTAFQQFADTIEILTNKLIDTY
eukprot:COSAG02_NODE_8590_length_2512_cov_1.718193_3_plen_63_part_01